MQSGMLASTEGAAPGVRVATVASAREFAGSDSL
jgi:hypothetical protein